MNRTTIFIAASLALVAASACDIGGGVYVLGEEEGVAVLREALVARGYHPDDGSHAVANVIVCPAAGEGCDPALSYVLDGWDAAAGVGFEYVSEADPDFPGATALTSGAPSDRRDAAVALQEATNAEVSPGVVLVVRRWAHETAFLAREQLRAHADGELDALGLFGPAVGAP